MKRADEEIGLYVPTRGHVWYGTATALAQIGMVNDIGLPTYVRGVTGPAEVRNEIVQLFLESGKDVLVMVDDDVIPPRHFLQIVIPIIDGDAEIVAACVPIMRPGTVFLPNLFVRDGDGYAPHLEAYQGEGLVEVDAVGTGCIAIARKVLLDNHLKTPFRPKLDKNGVWLMGEDITFCERAKARGHRVRADLNVWCEHLSELHCNSTAMAYMALLTELTSDDDEGSDPPPQPDLRVLLPEDVDDLGGVPATGDDLREGAVRQLPDVRLPAEAETAEEGDHP
jgi:glycosyltransferase involved in cell wall biosynthesis